MALAWACRHSRGARVGNPQRGCKSRVAPATHAGCANLTLAKERGWGTVTRAHFDAQLGPNGALLIGEAEEVAEKILRHSEALGGVSRFTFQMNASSLPHAKLMKATEVIGQRVVPLVRG